MMLWPSCGRHSAALTNRLARTPQQLDVLASAGVVDAGGQAYVLLIDVLARSARRSAGPAADGRRPAPGRKAVTRSRGWRANTR